MKLELSRPVRPPVSPQARRRARRWARRLAVAGETSLYALEKVGISPIAMFDRLSRWREPKDAARRVARGVTYGAHRRQKLDVYLPVRRGSAPLPILLFFYGGGWVKGERGEFGWVARAMAARGYMVVLPDYRLAPQYRFPAFIEDGALAVKWALDHGGELGGDPARLALAGHSAGGHLAGILSLDPRYLAAAGVAPEAIRAAALISAPTNFLPFVDPRAIAALGRHRPEHETQPYHLAHGAAPPLLLLHGTADIIVRARNAQQLHRKVLAAGGEAEMKLYRGLTHSDPIKAFSPIVDKADIAGDLDAFLKARLG
ncbi:alpha/beta hydrolase [Sphingomicrobium astaxanthinifaciens]|uniref:alpha/beta hydrolase n=1 Tax=Sphingomicrobium astaxanthinifaciens TaxID=1227949 RepID=UPI001FCC9DDF|nr:alpha/beta hydrolase [Sphingomicrobium astaxanthinifaciens]MCJ7421488.1 alpha/beta hydrolase [Sphingomicrobium astaxanthinifaciens]